MEENGQSELEVELYEEIVNLNYSMPMASRAPSPFHYEEDLFNITHFNGPIVGDFIFPLKPSFKLKF